jgi:hypothetical protein
MFITTNDRAYFRTVPNDSVFQRLNLRRIFCGFYNIYEVNTELYFLLLGLLLLNAHYFLNRVNNVELRYVLSKFSRSDLGEVQKVLNHIPHDLSWVLLNLQPIVKLLNDFLALANWLILYKVFFYLNKRLHEILIKMLLFNILGNNRIQRVPELMRHTSVDQWRELILRLDIQVLNVMRYIIDLYHIFELFILFIPFNFDLDVPCWLAGLVLENGVFQ